ncbi:glycosyl transferase family 64 domain-containing protein [Dunaliella salina]|uniref:Glycosyl transferase family 64 domain-containing protein n=1 Tax=Dunaliella salina TaxID=3046 RepID=A0ABQ7G4F1_DUNSA|nr:glycosyl transferase family 64 domain-containing protein [Dunaliella salina]|eukprot:KAF5829480.1 glycosyl transferase family 64 domain-containing protein [Dunaliella salina]
MHNCVAHRLSRFIMLSAVALCSLFGLWIGSHTHVYGLPGVYVYGPEGLHRHPPDGAPVPEADLIPNKFTIQIMTYKRPAHLMAVINHHVHAPSLHKIVVIWQHTLKTFHAARLHSALQKLPKPVEVVIAGTNDVTNRWRRQPPTRTKAVFNIDDDAMVDIADLEGAFQVWQQYPDRVLGFYERVIFLDELEGAYLYSYDAGVVSPEKYAMVIGKAWFAGPSILDLADTADPLFMRFSAFLHNTSRESKGCDDIAWNYFLHLKGAPEPLSLYGVSMTNVLTHEMKSTGYSVRSENGAAWVPYRHACINRLHQALGLSKPSLPKAPLQTAFLPSTTLI